MNLSPPNKQHHLTHPKYRADIDGLRAVAILSVVGYHAFPSWVKGGFVGVDVFFVISGFLISTIIFGSLDKGIFSFKEFYARRIKRIFPALILVMTACYALGWFMLLPDEYKQLGKHIAAGTGFVSNLFFWQEAGYFDNAAETKPLLHLWSLGIEEQFYIVWPLLLYLTWKRRFNLLLLTVTIIAISFVINVVKVHGDAVQAFYSPVSRFWELMLGSLLAYLALHKISLWDGIKQKMGASLGGIISGNTPAQDSPALRNVLSLFGALLIAVAVLVVDREKEFPGWWVLLPTLGAYLVICAGPQAWLNRVVLSHRVVVWFGLISYPIYLWHWPLLSFARIVEPGIPTLKIRIATIFIAIALAWLTYKFIERPVRFGNHSKNKVTASCLLILAIGYVGFNTYTHNGYGFRLPKPFDIVGEFNKSDEWRKHQCFLDLKEDKSKFTGDCLDHNNKPLIFLWGDSHAAALYPGLKALKETHGVGIAQYTAADCPPLLNLATEENTLCKDINDSNLILINTFKPDIVLLHSNWKALGSTVGRRSLFYTIAELQKIGIKKIVLLGPTPLWIGSLKRQLFTHYMKDPFKNPPPQYIRFGLEEYRLLEDQYIRTVAASVGVDFISAYNIMCGSDGCLTRVGEDSYNFTTFDNGHLSPQASRYLINHISEDLLSGVASILSGVASR